MIDRSKAIFPACPASQSTLCVATHIGDRQDQQDRVAIITSPRNPGAVLAIVADGMGGRTGGRKAADQVISTAENLFQDMSHRDSTLRDLLLHLAAEAHTIIRLTAIAAEKEPHSTLCALIIQKQSAVWAHVGDSRLYYFRGGKLMHRTEDHTYAAAAARRRPDRGRRAGKRPLQEHSRQRARHRTRSRRSRSARRVGPARRRCIPAGERRPVGPLRGRRTGRGAAPACRRGRHPNTSFRSPANAPGPRRQRFAGHHQARSPARQNAEA